LKIQLKSFEENIQELKSMEEELGASSPTSLGTC